MHACRQGTVGLQTLCLALNCYLLMWRCWLEISKKNWHILCLLLANVQDGGFKRTACDSELRHKCKISLSLQSLQCGSCCTRYATRSFFFTLVWCWIEWKSGAFSSCTKQKTKIKTSREATCTFLAGENFISMFQFALKTFRCLCVCVHDLHSKHGMFSEAVESQLPNAFWVGGWQTTLGDVMHLCNPFPKLLEEGRKHSNGYKGPLSFKELM